MSSVPDAVSPLPRPRPRSLRAAQAWLAQLAGALQEERRRWPFWLPVAFGLGIGVYFALPVEPPAWLAWTSVAAAAIGLALARGKTVAMPVALGILAANFGFTLGVYRSLGIDHSILDRRIGPLEIAGRVVEIEERAVNWRMTIDNLTAVEPLGPRVPSRVRLTLPAPQHEPSVGQWLRMRVILQPPAAPTAPGAFDFQRYAFFQRLGASGFILSQPIVLDSAPRPSIEDSWLRTWALSLSDMRRQVTRRILAALPGTEGAIAAALLTGEQGSIPEPTMQAVRDSGLAHLLSISGLHLSLVTAIVFFTIRGGLALVEPLALRWPTKKIAAAIAFAAAFGYLLLSGAAAPTQRAFVMISIVLLAVLIDRTALSMRTVAWAAGVVLLWSPESLLSASFQMSFAAVVVLIAAYESGDRWLSGRGGGDGGMVRFGRHVAGLAVVSMLATAATAPFTVYHFGRLPAYGVFANMLAVPLAEIWVMPWGLLALALMPFGLEDWALAPMGLGIAGLVGIADGFAALPGAALILPSFSTPSLVAMSLGGLWICMWRESHRWLGVGLVGVGLATAPLERFPDILISADGRAIAVRLENGRYSLSSRQQRFVSDAWLRRAGQSEAELWPKPGTADGGMSCDRVGCRIRMPYRPEVWAVLQPEGLRAACSASDAVVVTGLWVKNCSKPQLVIDRSALQRNGTHALWLDPGRVRAESVRRWQGARPWVPRPPWSHNRPND